MFATCAENFKKTSQGIAKTETFLNKNSKSALPDQCYLSIPGCRRVNPDNNYIFHQNGDYFFTQGMLHATQVHFRHIAPHPVKFTVLKQCAPKRPDLKGKVASLVLPNSVRTDMLAFSLPLGVSSNLSG